jgi:hypothetical protein
MTTNLTKNIFKKFLKVVIFIITPIFALYINTKPNIQIVSTFDKIDLLTPTASLDTIKLFVDYRLSKIPIINSLFKIRLTININGDFASELSCHEKKCGSYILYNYTFPILKTPINILKTNDSILLSIYARNRLHIQSIQQSIKIIRINELGNNKIKEKTTKEYSGKIYKDRNGYDFYLVLTETGSIKEIHCIQTNMTLSWLSINRSPYWIVKKDTLMILTKAVNWLHDNQINDYRYLIKNTKE